MNGARGGEEPIRPAVGAPARQRLLVVSASMGAGHTGVAAELARRLGERGHEVRVVDYLRLPRHGEGRCLRWTYAALLRRAPWLYDAAMRTWQRYPAAVASLNACASLTFDRALAGEVAAFRPDVVVSTYNLASQSLGRLKAAGRLAAATATYVTDPGAHPYWVHPAVELHLAVTARTAWCLHLLGAGRAVAVEPVVRSQFRRRRPAAERDELRRSFGLAPEDRVALVNGGSWGVGSLEPAVAALTAGGIRTLVLCGRAAALEARLERRGLGIPLGWIDDPSPAVASADVLVDNAGGQTCLEALSMGIPVVLFRPLPGHGRINARALVAAGLALAAGSPAELADTVRALAARRRPAPAAMRGAALPDHDAAEEILALAA